MNGIIGKIFQKQILEQRKDFSNFLKVHNCSHLLKIGLLIIILVIMWYTFGIKDVSNLETE